MKKTLKLLFILAVAIMVMASLSVNVFAAVDVDSVVDTVESSDGGAAASNVAAIGGTITGIITTVGIVAAIIILMIVGIKYMAGSASEKAEYKKVMIPYIIGAVILFGASAIVKALSTWNILG
jgi:type IV secretory pathway VirB2 component (pilin)